MSLCPNFCECPACKHGIKVCADYACLDCIAEREGFRHQEEHERSVIKQKAKLRIPSWKKDLQ